MRLLSDFFGFQALLQTYYAYSQSQISFRKMFWGYSYDVVKVCWMQKEWIRLVTKSSLRDPCRQCFRQFKILPLPSPYIFRSLVFVHSNSDKFYGKNHVHRHFSRNSSSAIASIPIIEQTLLKSLRWYSCTNVFNNLPNRIRLTPILRLLRPCACNIFWTTACIAFKSRTYE